VKQVFLHANDGKYFQVLVEGKGIGWTQNYIECNEDNFELATGFVFTKKTIVEGIYRYKN
jgi:hypothetical protein